MLLSLAQWLQQLSPEFGFFRVFQYLTFRAVMAAMTALLIGLAFGPWVIRRLAALKIGQPVRGYGMESHLAKSGTPTMGGVLILIGIGISTMLWFDWSNRFVWIVMLVTMGFGAIGWADDWRKVVDKNPEGMRSREKFFWQSLIGLVAALYLAFSVSETSNLRVLELFIRWVQSGFSNDLPPKADLMVPFVKTISYPLGVFGFIILTWLVIVGSSNAVNLPGRLGRDPLPAAWSDAAHRRHRRLLVVESGQRGECFRHGFTCGAGGLLALYCHSRDDRPVHRGRLRWQAACGSGDGCPTQHVRLPDRGAFPGG